MRSEARRGFHPFVTREARDARLTVILCTGPAGSLCGRSPSRGQSRLSACNRPARARIPRLESIQPELNVDRANAGRRLPRHRLGAAVEAVSACAAERHPPVLRRELNVRLDRPAGCVVRRARRPERQRARRQAAGRPCPRPRPGCGFAPAATADWAAHRARSVLADVHNRPRRARTRGRGAPERERRGARAQVRVRRDSLARRFRHE